MGERLLVTGGAGFLGWHLCNHLLEERPGTSLVVLDAFTYAAGREGVRRLKERWGARYTVVEGDVTDPASVSSALRGVDAVFHLAAESHVDRSIQDAAPFVRTNVVGTQVVVDAVLSTGTPRLLHVSTDEVYGHIPRDADPGTRFTESSPLQPRSPYAASKAAADLLIHAAVTTHDLPAVIVRPCNAWGEAQYPEKLIPVAIRCAMEGRPVPVYGDGRQVREWAYAGDHARGMVAALERGRVGQTYNLGGAESLENLQVVGAVLDAVGAPSDGYAFVADRPGHDQRYAMDSGRAAVELGWEAGRGLAVGLSGLLHWYRSHSSDWWVRV